MLIEDELKILFKMATKDDDDDEEDEEDEEGEED